jgi:molecular chaperone GrpE
VDDHIKQTLLSRFQTYLDNTNSDEPESPEETADLYALFVEVAGLRSEVRTESRLVKEALDQFRAVFDALQASQAQLQQELDRARAAPREAANAALRPLLLDVIDLRDRLLAALKFADTTRPNWVERLFRRKPAGEAGAEPDSGQTWQSGLRLTLRRLDQVLADRRVVPTQVVGRPLDPRQARVVAVTSDADARDGTVVEEVRAGFLWEDQILRIADVIVAKAAANQSGEKT